MIDKLINVFKVIFIGIVEGISEWLPISSTGHMLLVDEFINFDSKQSFKDLFFVVIQLGAILAVIKIFFSKINFVNLKEKSIKKDVLKLWYKVIVSCIPGVIVTLLFDDFIECYFYNPIAIAIMLIIYGVAFIVVENRWKNEEKSQEITCKDAFLIGMFQCLAIFPGTSRSGATILGALIIGRNRKVASEYTFILAIPVMFGLSALKLINFGFSFSSDELILLIIGGTSAFITSLIVVKSLMKYIENHNFKVFGIYRIMLGIIVLMYFVIWYKIDTNLRFWVLVLD